MEFIKDLWSFLKERKKFWLLPLILVLLLFGVLVIILNYLQVLPGSVSPWYLATGLGAMFAAFYLATRYR